jgi:hypothetical protein
LNQFARTSAAIHQRRDPPGVASFTLTIHGLMRLAVDVIGPILERVLISLTSPLTGANNSETAFTDSIVPKTPFRR